MEKKENKKVDWILIVAIIIVLISVFLFVFSLNLDNFVSLQVEKIPVIVIISNHSGINISEDRNILNLGNVKKNDFVSRNLIISSNYNFSTLFEFEVEGNISDLLIYYEKIIFEPFEDKNITFQTKIIQDEEFGEYSGVITVRIKKVPQ
jgi:hypothetical protein